MLSFDRAGQFCVQYSSGWKQFILSHRAANYCVNEVPLSYQVRPFV